MNDILVSKIVGSPSEIAWSQASSTGKLYIVISLYSDKEKDGIIVLGKNVLEQIQREFFAIDNKNLFEIKNAVEKVFLSLNKDISYSAVIAAIKNDILYVVTASSATVLIERGNNLAEVAHGEEGEIIGFSGKLKNNDMIIIETEKFNKKISNKLLAEYTGGHDNEKLAEDLAPFIHENSKGEEAAIIIHFKNPIDSSINQTVNTTETNNNYPEKKPNKETASNLDSEVSKETSDKKFSFFSNLSNIFKKRFNNTSKKQRNIITFAIIITLLLIGSLFVERYMDKNKTLLKEFNVVFEQSTQKLENAENLSGLNRGRALEEVNEAIQNIDSNLNKFNEQSKEYEQLTDLLDKLNALRNELDGGNQIDGNIIFKAEDGKILDKIEAISVTAGNLIVVGKKGFTIITEKGDIESEQDLEASNVRRIISDDTYLYILADNISRTTISNGNNVEIIANGKDFVDISYFGSNVYLIDNRGEVKKYSGNSFSESEYFKNQPDFSGSVISLAIDSSIYILTDKGTIDKFIKGARDSDFELDSSMKISKNSLLYTNEDLSNIYILDIDNASIVQISPNGIINSKLNSLELQNAKSFTVNTNESKAYVVIDNQVFSFDL